jgi:DNA-binding transcriptional ArsR family regulator
MEAKEFAKLFGGFSTEKRVLIIKTLMEAGKEGISLNELSRMTELSVIDIGIAGEALLMMGLIDIAVRGEHKMLTANYTLLSSLFDEAYHEFGPGRGKRVVAELTVDPATPSDPPA